MSNRNDAKRRKLRDGIIYTAIAVAIVVIFAVVGWVLVDQNARQNEREQANRARTDYSEVRVECEAEATLVAKLECLIEKAAVTHQQKHNEADLKAQDDVASSTAGLFWVGIIGLLVSVGGIWVIYETLRETRNMTVATRHIGEAQIRAYVRPSTFHIKMSPNGYKPIMSLKNSGQSPSGYVSFAGTAQVGDENTRPDIDGAAKEPFTVIGGFAAGEERRCDIFDLAEITKIEYDAIQEGRYFIWYVGILKYKDIFNLTNTYTFVTKHAISKSKDWMIYGEFEEQQVQKSNVD